MGTTSGHEAGVEAQAFSEGHTSGGEVMLEAFQPQENGEALAPVGIDSFHSSENDMFGLGGEEGEKRSMIEKGKTAWKGIRFGAAMVIGFLLVVAAVAFVSMFTMSAAFLLLSIPAVATFGGIAAAEVGVASISFGGIATFVYLVRQDARAKKGKGPLRNFDSFIDRIIGE